MVVVALLVDQVVDVDTFVDVLNTVEVVFVVAVIQKSFFVNPRCFIFFHFYAKLPT